MNRELRHGVDWVGHVDWDVRDFHGYRTDRGSTYNAYLVRSEKTALIDTVKAPYAEQLLASIGERVPPAEVDFIVCNHAEPDHSGSLPAILAACPKARLVCDEKCRDALGRHYDTSEWDFLVVSDGEELSLGRRRLQFLETPMVHWPESMATYLPEEKILFSMDAFGQHYASAHRFDDEEPLDVLIQEAKTYFANIVMLYSKPIERVLDRAGEFDIEMIAPSHGVIWRSHVGAILAAYRDWVAHKPRAKVLVLYDTMWQSTQRMAKEIVDGALECDVDVRLYHVRHTNLTVLATEVLDAAAIAVGSPTLNRTLMPEVAAVLTYLKGLRPANKAGLAFGSYGWTRGGATDVQEYLKAMKFEILTDPILAQFVPQPDVLDACRSAGRMLAGRALASAENAGTAAPRETG